MIHLHDQYKPLINTPIDSRSKIANLSNLALHLPIETRSTGIPVWVESENEYYTFIGGTSDVNFVRLVNATLVKTFSDTFIATVQNNEVAISHNLGSIKILELKVYDVDTNERIYCDYYFGGTQNLNPNEFVLLGILGGVSEILVEFLYMDV